MSEYEDENLARDRLQDGSLAFTNESVEFQPFSGESRAFLSLLSIINSTLLRAR